MSTDDEPIEDDGPVEPIADAATPRGIHLQKERVKREKLEADGFWTSVLATPIGRRELWRLIGQDAHAFQAQFPSGPAGVPDANAAWYSRGEQDFGLRLYHKLLALDPVTVAIMHSENDPRFPRPPKPRRSRVIDG